MSLRRLNQSNIGLTDSYKVTHHLQYPPGLTKLFSYFESRGGEFAETVFFGLQYPLIEYLSTPITQEDVAYFDERFAKHFGTNGLYNRGDWQKIVDEYEGRLPVEIRAVPEGLVVPTGNVLATIVNTDDRFPWVTNYLETLISMIWYPCTVATLSREARVIIEQYAALTGSSPEGVLFKLHDFGFRGSTSLESAALGGAAHLVNFRGTDTMIALEFAKEYYHEDMAGYSIGAAEHSTIMSWEKELDAFRNMIARFGNGAPGIFAVVSDTYDIYNACENLWGTTLRDEVLNMPNMLVVRPDSGDVRTVVAKVLDILGEKFGYTINEQGYKVLNKVRVIQGDGMDLAMIEAVCHDMYSNQWAIDNIAFGMGAGLLQRVDRDTSRYAFKACAVTRDGVEHGIAKNPATDAKKKSKAGRLTLARDIMTGEYRTVHPNDVIEGIHEDVMNIVFRNGELIGGEQTLADIRARAAVEKPVFVEV